LASKGTARSFYAAGTFYEVLQQFHDETIKNKIGDDLNEDEASVMEHIEEEDQRRIYCKWKATEILNAIKEGRTPTPGGYQQEHAEPDEMAEEAERIERVESKNNLPLPPPPPKFVEIWDAADHDSDANHGMPPPLPPHSYDGIELSLSGHPTSTKTTATTKTDDDITQDMITPVSPPKKQSLSPSPPPPSYSQQHSSNESRSGGGSSSGSNGGGGGGGQGIFSSVFHSKLASSPTSNKKLSKEQMGDAIELTKFALAALQNGDGELGRERLEQALGLWR
jgi:vacuolar protein sorting-associated protein VTA1